MSELHTQDPNLGFATLDDWFGQTGEGDLLDLQDFWFQVGPGEASRTCDITLTTGSRRVPIPMIMHSF